MRDHNSNLFVHNKARSSVQAMPIVNLKCLLQTTRCWATPTIFANDSTYYSIIENGYAHYFWKRVACSKKPVNIVVIFALLLLSCKCYQVPAAKYNLGLFLTFFLVLSSKLSTICNVLLKHANNLPWISTQTFPVNIPIFSCNIWPTVFLRCFELK